MKVNNAKIIILSLIALFAIHGLYLYFTDKLNFYIHPRYSWLSVTASAITLMVTMMGIIQEILLSKKRKRKPKNKIKIDELIIFGFAILVAFLLPVKALTSATASQRQGNLNSLRGDSTEISSPFKISTENYSLGDWIISLQNNPDSSTYDGKKVNIDGFIFPDEASDADHFTIARFILTCCAVDATPVGIRVYSKNWNRKYNKDDWVKLSGEFKIDPSTNKIFIFAEKLEVTEVPNDPYIY